MIPPQTDGVAMRGYGIKYLFSDSAHLKARIVSDKVIEKHEERKDQKITIHYLSGGVKAEFFGSLGQVETIITSQEASIQKEEGIAELTGNVIATNAKGERLETEKLFWNKNKDLIYTPLFVRIQTQDKMMTGDGFESKTDLSSYKIFKAKGTVQMNGDL